MAKGIRAPIANKTSSPIGRKLRRVFVDLREGKELRSPGGKRCATVFRADYSISIWVHFLRKKVDGPSSL